MTTTTIEPVRTQVRVKASPERAFQAFIDMSAWWPLDSHHIGEAAAAEAVVERRDGGRWYERGDDGTECEWGRVLVYEPPARLVLVWQTGADWKHHPELHTEVEVTFTPDGDGTLVALEHRDLEAFGEAGPSMRETFGSPGGWSGLLERFAANL